MENQNLRTRLDDPDINGASNGHIREVQSFISPEGGSRQQQHDSNIVYTQEGVDTGVYKRVDEEEDEDEIIAERQDTFEEEESRNRPADNNFGRKSHNTPLRTKEMKSSLKNQYTSYNEEAETPNKEDINRSVHSAKRNSVKKVDKSLQVEPPKKIETPKKPIVQPRVRSASTKK
jgi:hypothetical protein